MKKKILYTRCEVCHTVYKDGCGSSPCCGSVQGVLFEDEVIEMGINLDETANKGTKREDFE